MKHAQFKQLPKNTEIYISKKAVDTNSIEIAVPLDGDLIDLNYPRL